MKVNFSSAALAIAAAMPIGAGIVSYATVSDSYNQINNAAPTLSTKEKARLAWLDAARNGEVIHSPSLLGQKRTAVTSEELAVRGLQITDDIKTALGAVGLNYTN